MSTPEGRVRSIEVQSCARRDGGGPKRRWDIALFFLVALVLPASLRGLGASNAPSEIAQVLLPLGAACALGLWISRKRVKSK